MEGSVDLGDHWPVTYQDGLVAYPPTLQTVTHPSTNPAVHGRESNSQPVDHNSQKLTTTLPSRI